MISPYSSQLKRANRTKLPTGPSHSLPYTKSIVERIAQHQLICVDTSSEVQRLTKVNHQSCKSQTGESQALVMWSSTCSMKASTFPSGQLTALLPLELSSIVCGYSESFLACSVFSSISCLTHVF